MSQRPWPLTPQVDTPATFEDIPSEMAFQEIGVQINFGVPSLTFGVLVHFPFLASFMYDISSRSVSCGERNKKKIQNQRQPITERPRRHSEGPREPLGIQAEGEAF